MCIRDSIWANIEATRPYFQDIRVDGPELEYVGFWLRFWAFIICLLYTSRAPATCARMRGMSQANVRS